MTHENNGQTGPDLPRTADLLRRERPKASPLRLDEIKRDVVRRSTRTREPRVLGALRRRVMALTLFVMLFGISTSNAAASLLNWVSGGSFGSNTLGYGKQSSGMQFFFGSFGVGGHSSDDAGKETYCPDDRGSDDGDKSSDDDSDGDKGNYSSYGKTGGQDYSDDSDKSSGDDSDRNDCPTDSDKSSDKSSDRSDDNDKSSDDQSDRDAKSDDNDKSSDDQSD